MEQYTLLFSLLAQNVHKPQKTDYTTRFRQIMGIYFSEDANVQRRVGIELFPLEICQMIIYTAHSLCAIREFKSLCSAFQLTEFFFRKFFLRIGKSNKQKWEGKNLAKLIWTTKNSSRTIKSHDQHIKLVNNFTALIASGLPRSPWNCDWYTWVFTIATDCRWFALFHSPREWTNLIIPVERHLGRTEYTSQKWYQDVFVLLTLRSLARKTTFIVYRTFPPLHFDPANAKDKCFRLKSAAE